jgi:hypothetical protein
MKVHRYSRPHRVHRDGAWKTARVEFDYVAMSREESMRIEARRAAIRLLDEEESVRKP